MKKKMYNRGSEAGECQHFSGRKTASSAFNCELARLLSCDPEDALNDLEASRSPTQTDIPFVVAALDAHVAKLLKKQDDMGYQVHEIYEVLEQDAQDTQQVQDAQDALLSALITAADIMEDFYLYYQERIDESLTPQSAMM